MSIKQFSADGRTTVNWTSGTSTEIFIHPSNGNFAERNFLFRISTATVEAEESTFTFFKGITRHLMILKGKLELIHQGRYTKHLEPYDQDTFSGEWNTFSRGKVTDFNLMLKAGAAGSLTHHQIDKGHGATFTAKTDHHFIYLASGLAMLSNGMTAEPGNLLWIGNKTELSVQSHEPCDWIEIEVSL